MIVDCTGAQTATANGTITYNGVPSQYRPTSMLELPIRVTNSGTITWSLLEMKTDGVFNIYNVVAGGIFTNGQSFTVYGGSWSWNGM